MGFKLTPVVKYLLLINIGIYFLMFITGGKFYSLLALHNINSDGFYPFQFLTHMFLHDLSDPMHLLGNMFGLFMFGPMLESVWGAKRFITFYLFCGLGAAFLYTSVQYYDSYKLNQTISEYKINPDPQSFGVILYRYFDGYQQRNEEGEKAFYVIYPAYKANPTSEVLAKNSIEYLYELYKDKVNSGSVVGASGAIFGILMAFAMLFPNTELLLFLIPFPIKAKYLVACYGIYELYAGFHRIRGDNVAHFAHIGGMIFAFILIKYWQRKRNTFY